MLKNGDVVYFKDFKHAETTELITGLGKGKRTLYSGLDNYSEASFELSVLVNDTSGFVDCTFVPLNLDGLPVKEVRWPAPLMADDDKSYAVLNTMQGQLLPSASDFEFSKPLPFDGQMCSESAYMPWWGEITPLGGYMCRVREPWDSAYNIEHKAGGPNRIYIRHLPEKGFMRAPRTVSYCFTPRGSSYVDLCHLYRKIADEEGQGRTLKEKAAQNPLVNELIGSCVMHCAGKTHVTRDSSFYNKEDISKNDSLVPFSHWEERVKMLKRAGLNKLYLHLDGWAEPGYDNKHPDYFPPCEALGGKEGLKRLSDTVRGCGYLFGIHDQYRDYYLDAPSYDIDNAAESADGSVFEMSRWAGGRQNYLCASLAPAYVQRNFKKLFDANIHLDAAYLDVFTCNEADECVNPRHPMSRRECLNYRGQCLNYLTSHNIMPSSEEVNDWAVKYQVFCHWAPYYAEAAIPVPLFNLTWHDSVIIPWMLGENTWGIPKGTNGFLHALLNGGIGYLDENVQGEELKQNIDKIKVLSALNEKVAMHKMVSHEFLNEKRTRQKTTFENGVSVTVDFENNTYNISE